MFSTTVKRSVATLGVVAGLLAAVGPASAQILDGPVLAKAGPQPEAGGYLATDPSSEVDSQVMIIDGNNLDRVFQIRGDAQDTQEAAPAASGHPGLGLQRQSAADSLIRRQGRSLSR